MTFYRDLTFHSARRSYGNNIPCTDLDFVEYDHLIPVALKELKSRRSHWREGRRTASARVQLKIAQMLGIPYFIDEHSDDFSSVSVCRISEFNGRMPVIENESQLSLIEYVEHLYTIREREMPELVRIRVPERLEPVTRLKYAEHLVDEMTDSEKQALIDYIKNPPPKEEPKPIQFSVKSLLRSAQL